MNRARKQPQSAERGSTVAETLIALAIASAISLAAISALRSASDHDSTQATTLANHNDVSRSMDQILVDIRGSVFVPELGTQLDLSDSLPLLVPSGSGEIEFVEWSIDGFGITRSASPLIPIDPQPGWTTTAIVRNPNTATFVYLNSRGEELDLLLDPEELKSCTAAIAIRLHRSVQDEAFSTAQTSAASFRLNDGAQSC